MRLSVVVLVLVAFGMVLSDDDNSTQVEENQVETFEMVEKMFKNAASSAIRKLLPYLLESGSRSKISGQCSASLMRVIGGIRQLREWAVRFIDASGKIPPGVLEGTSFSIGDYDECLAIEVGKRDDPPQTPEDVLFRGKYCLLEFRRPEGIMRAIQDYHSGNKESPIAKTKTFLNMYVRYKHLSNTTFKIGSCIPSKCSESDMQEILNSVFTRIKMTVAHCEVKEDHQMTVEQTFLLCIFSFILGCMILGTVVDVFMRLRKGESDSSTKRSIKNSLLQNIRTASLYSNALDVVNTAKSHEPLRCLCALRTITVVLTIYSHTYGHIHSMHFQKFSKAANFLKFFDSFTFSGIANGSVGMDTIVFIAGITITYNRWRKVTEKGKVKLNLINLVLQRYFRMTAAQLLVICLFLLLPLLGSGPLWTAYTDPLFNNCRQRWWLHVLYIQNFWGSVNVCLYHTWILAVIMQLTIVSTVVLWILKRSARCGILFIVCLVLAGIIGVAVMTVINDLPGSMAFFMLDLRTGPITWRDVYTLAYDHVGPFCIGLLTGYFLAIKKEKLEINRTTSVILWCCSIICNTSVMFGLYSYRHGDKMDLSLSTFYAVMHRNVWALGIAWLVVACATRHAGAVARVMHSNVFLPIDRLCYMAFLLHIPLMYYHGGSIRDRWYMGHFELMFLAIGYIILSFLLSFLVHIVFVSPFYHLEDLVSSCFSSKDKVTIECKSDRTIPLPIVVSGSSEDGRVDNGCINVAYSKKLDGF